MLSDRIVRLDDFRNWLATLCANRPTKERLLRSCIVDDPSNPETLAEFSTVQILNARPRHHDNRFSRRDMSSGDRLRCFQRFRGPGKLDRVLQGGQRTEAVRRLQLMLSVRLRDRSMLPLLQAGAHVPSRARCASVLCRRAISACVQKSGTSLRTIVTSS